MPNSALVVSDTSSLLNLALIDCLDRTSSTAEALIDVLEDGA